MKILVILVSKLFGVKLPENKCYTVDVENPNYKEYVNRIIEFDKEVTDVCSQIYRTGLYSAAIVLFLGFVLPDVVIFSTFKSHVVFIGGILLYVSCFIAFEYGVSVKAYYELDKNFPDKYIDGGDNSWKEHFHSL